MNFAIRLMPVRGSRTPVARVLLLNAHVDPRRLLVGGKPLLPFEHPRRVVPLGDGHAGVPEQARNFIERHSSQQVLDGEGVPQHMKVSGFRATVRIHE